MKQTDEETYNDIRSGKYFIDAVSWYKHKYIHPLSQRSLVLILSIMIFVIFLGLCANIYALLPTVIQVKYTVQDAGIESRYARITSANAIESDAKASILNIMVSNYVTKRESYNYELLKKQFLFIKNNSTRIVFKDFYNSMNIDNPLSPVMRYRKDIKRKVGIKSIKHIAHDKISVEFSSIAINANNVVIEDMLWSADINYEIDEINPNLSAGSKFNFTVTEYKLKLLQDNKSK